MSSMPSWPCYAPDERAAVEAVLASGKVNYWTGEQARRHEVRPGITGWAQVNGRNSITWDQKLAYDVWYVDHRSMWLDVRILGLSVLRVLSAQGISQPGHTTAEKFRGSAR